MERGCVEDQPQHPRNVLRLTLRAQPRSDRMLTNQSSGEKCGLVGWSEAPPRESFMRRSAAPGVWTFAVGRAGWRQGRQLIPAWAVMGASDYRHRGVGETERGCVRSTSRSGISPPLRIRARCGWSFGHSRGPVVVEDAPGRHSPCGEGWIRLVFVVNRSSARVAQLDRVTASEAAGCGFDSRRAHQPPHDGSAKCEVSADSRSEALRVSRGF